MAARAAIKAWAAELRRNRGIFGPTETFLFHDLEAIVRAVQGKEADLLILLTSEYIELKDRIGLEPRFAPHRAGKVTDEVLLLVHRQSGIRTLAGLRGKDLLILNDARGSLGRNWLETHVMSLGVLELDDFFGAVENTTRYSRTVLPIFFRQADVCLVPRVGFNTMTELNPQLGKDLQVLDASPSALPSVLCIRPDFRVDLKEALIDALSTLHEEPRGQQILMMFKVDGLVPFQVEFLGAAQQILTDHAVQKEALLKARLAPPIAAERP